VFSYPWEERDLAVAQCVRQVGRERMGKRSENVSLGNRPQPRDIESDWWIDHVN